MKVLISLLAAATLLSACGTLPSVTSTATGGVASTASDATALGGLPNSQAAHPSVQLGRPAAYVLSGQAGPFLAALERTVGPMREALASRLATDATVTQGLAAWDRSTSAQQLTVLKRVATIQAEVMGCSTPTITMQTGAAADATMLAYYQPGLGAGEIVLYSRAVASGGKYKAVATLVHEMRHAAQYQLMTAGTGILSTAEGDQRTLATAYSASWAALDALGSESSLAYGDYAHLNVEYDAFQTGNEVAARLAGSQYDPVGFGFVDTHYASTGAVKLDLVSLAGSLTGVNLVAAVNQAEYQAQKGRSVTLSPVTRGRMPRGTFR